VVTRPRYREPLTDLWRRKRKRIGERRKTFTGKAFSGCDGSADDLMSGWATAALWNYTQHYTLRENSFDTVFGPSTPGAVNLISGQTRGVYSVDS
jgi:phospholipase C